VSRPRGQDRPALRHEYGAPAKAVDAQAKRQPPRINGHRSARVSCLPACGTGLFHAAACEVAHTTEERRISSLEAEVAALDCSQARRVRR